MIRKKSLSYRGESSKKSVVRFAEKATFFVRSSFLLFCVDLKHRLTQKMRSTKNQNEDTRIRKNVCRKVMPIDQAASRCKLGHRNRMTKKIEETRKFLVCRQPNLLE